MATIDHDWRIVTVSNDINELLGWRADQWVGRPLLGELHPADVGGLYHGALQAMDAHGALEIEARLREPAGSWKAIRLVLIPQGTGRELPSMLVTLSAATSLPAQDARWAEWTELSAGLHGAEGVIRRMALAMPAVELSTRQLEIVSRLLRGERVPTVAAEMHLSQSTIRTHLGVVFRKFGVKSQEALIQKLRRSLDDPSR